MPRRDSPVGVPSLVEALRLQNVEHVRCLARTACVSPLPTRKNDLVEALAGTLLSDRLREIWSELDPLEQSAVREAMHDPTGRFDGARFRAKYGELPSLHREMRGRDRNRLALFLHATERYRYDRVAVPTDLAARLRDYVPPPKEAAMASLGETPDRLADPAGSGLTVRVMERAARRDLVAVLRLIERGGLSVSARTGVGTAAGIRLICESLADGDFFDHTKAKKENPWDQIVGPVRGFAWPLLVQAGGLAKPSGSKLELTRAGRAALAAPPAESLRKLWSKWLRTRLFDEFRRVEAVKGQRSGGGRSRTMTAPRNRRDAVDLALRDCPVGEWVEIEEFSRFMQAAGHDFKVAHQPWRLYFSELRYGSLGYEPTGTWRILEERYLLCLLFEYAATLGMIDVAYADPRGARSDYLNCWGTDELEFLSRYDGLACFRLNPLGAYCLDLADTYESSEPAARTRLQVFSRGTLRVTGEPLSTDERMLLEKWAVEEDGDGWRIDRSRAVEALENGGDVEELRTFLAERDDQPLPETVEGLLANLARQAGALRHRGMAAMIECANTGVADRIAADPTAGKLCRRGGERLLIVPGASETAFRAAVRALGYGIANA